MISLLTNGEDILKAKEAHVENLRSCLEIKIRKLTSERSDFKTFCFDNLKEILDALPTRLEEIDLEFKSKFPDANWIDLAKEIFNYRSFIKKAKDKNPDYDAYTLADNLNIHSCPNCNAQYTKTVGRTKKLTRPSFDHFFPQADYPLLALSFFNLIPCCRICNTDIKGSRSFSLAENFHPYETDHEIEDSCRFTYYPKSPNGALGFNEDFDLRIVPLAHGKEKTRAEKHINDFKLETLYQAYKDQAAEVIQKQIAYPDSYLEQIQKLFGDKGGFSRAEFYRLAFGNYLDDKDLLKRPLSKMTRDLSKHY